MARNDFEMITADKAKKISEEYSVDSLWIELTLKDIKDAIQYAASRGDYTVIYSFKCFSNNDTFAKLEKSIEKVNEDLQNLYGFGVSYSADNNHPMTTITW